MSDLSYSGPVARLGYAELWQCDACGCAVIDMTTHTKWHESYAQVADDASWGGMLRPLG